MPIAAREGIPCRGHIEVEHLREKGMVSPTTRTHARRCNDKVSAVRTTEQAVRTGPPLSTHIEGILLIACTQAPNSWRVLHEFRLEAARSEACFRGLRTDAALVAGVDIGGSNLRVATRASFCEERTEAPARLPSCH